MTTVVISIWMVITVIGALMPQVNISSEAYERLNTYRQTDKGELSFSKAIISLLDKCGD